MSLIDLVSQYMNSASLRRAYAQDPTKVLATHGVKGAILKVLQEQGLADAIAAELEAAGRRAGGGIRPLGWGIAAMKITDFAPGSADIGVSFDLTIDGEEFTPETQAAVILGEHRLQNAITASRTVFNSSTQIVGTFNLARPGRYEVGAYRPATKDDLPSGAWLPGEKLVVGAADRAKKSKAKPRTKTRAKPETRSKAKTKAKVKKR